MRRQKQGLPAKANSGLASAIETLRNGGVIAYPTDTVYGLGCDAYNEAAVERVFLAKQRPLSMAVPLLASDIDMLLSAASGIPELALALARRFMPGALTLILLKSSRVPDIVTAGGDTVALRIPGHPVPQALASGLGSPIVGTSANLSGKPSPVTAEEVRVQLGGRIDAIIEGQCFGGVESTIVDMTGMAPMLVREGAIKRQTIEEAFGRIFSTAER